MTGSEPRPCRIRLPWPVYRSHHNEIEHQGEVVIAMSCGCSVVACLAAFDATRNTFGVCPICDVVNESLFGILWRAPLNVKCAWGDDESGEHEAHYKVSTKCGCIYFLCTGAVFELIDDCTGNVFTDYWRCLQCQAKDWDVVDIRPIQ